MEHRIDKLEKIRRSSSPKTRSTSPLTCYGCGNSGHFISQCPEHGVISVRFKDPKKRNGVGIDAPTLSPEQQGAEHRGEEKYESGRASWGSRSCPTGHPKDSPPQEVMNPNGLDPPHQPQKVVDPNGLDPPRQLQKVVNPNGLDPPDQLNLKVKLDLVASEGITGMQHQEIASGGKRFIICTGERK
ncbi:hypothetical protein PoB_005029800 [Plakobranchus ocellatus]|uniref:CCHC-type domain-containing protein n=1 Tax=Plakobranchus ocellatus TaxID=259542 RepID=A0AAV4BX46_9GAST|nr:hypothetical protein PoB_005029800 [Plakobranchus ocellatus]